MRNGRKASKRAAVALAALLLVSGAAVYGTASYTAGNPLSVCAAEAAETETYSVNVQMVQFHSTELSMGNASMKPEAHIVVNEDGTAELQIDMVSMTYLNRDGYLGWMKRVTKILSQNEYQYPTEYETEDVAAIEEYTDIYDIFNDPDSDYYDEKVGGKWYPKKLSVPIDFANREDDILIQVYVPVMESIMAGGGTKFAVLDIDWDSLQKEGDNGSGETKPAVTTTTSDTSKTDSTTTTTTTTAVSQPDTSTEDKNHLPDGTYELQAEMKKVDRMNDSMSNNGINHTVQLEVKDGAYTLLVQFKGLAIYNQFGYLQDLYYYKEGYTYDTYGQPQGSVEKAEVLSSYDVVDQYNDKDHLYPQLLRFPLVDKASGADGYVPLRVFVPIMEAIADGTGTQNVLMQLDWSTLKKTDGDLQLEEPEKQSAAFYYADPVTGIILEADKGVFTEKANVSSTEVTSGTEYTAAQEALTSLRAYEITLSEEPNGKFQISLPIPSGVSDPAVYRMKDGKKTKISGTVKDGYYVFSAKEGGVYAIGTAVASTGSTGSSGSSGTSRNVSASPKTGDSGAALLLGAAIAGAVTVCARRKKK